MISPLSGSTNGTDASINYQASISGTLNYNFNLYDMMSGGAMGYVTINGTYIEGVLYASGMSFTGTIAINSGDLVQIYFNIGGASVGMAYLTITSIYISV
jgi:hypothetical protein